jgi:hypothetical protein
MSSIKKKIVLFTILLGMVGVIIGVFQYYKPHRDLSHARPDHILSSIDLVNEFIEDEEGANHLYLGKILEVSGVITSIHFEEEDTHIALQSNDPLSEVIAEFQSGELLKFLEVGQTITVRGTCSGVLSDVILNRCVIVP